MKREMLAGLVAAMLLGGATDGLAQTPVLTEAAQSRSMIWNGVVVDRGRVFVAGPRWSGSTGPSVALVAAGGQLQPYPDATWNNWHPGADPSRTFINVNSIHPDGRGSLWVVDTGSTQFGGNPVPGGAKLVQIDLATAKVIRVITFDPNIALPGSYVDDIRFHGDFSYSTDAGRPGIIVVNLKTGEMRRVLEDIPATTAAAGRPIIVGGKILLGPNHKPMRVNTDPMEVSPDGKWFYFGTLEGPWSKIETRYLDDFSMTPEAVAAKVEPWADLPPTGGTAMDSNGNLYFSDLATSTIKRRSPDGQVTTILQDHRLHWVDAPTIDADHRLWLPVPQLDRAALFHDGHSEIQWPVGLYWLPLSVSPAEGKPQ